MRRFALVAAALTLGLTATSAPSVSAQGFVGAGVTTPMGDFGDGYKLGWAVNAGFRPYQSADERMSIWLEGLYGSNSLKNDLDGKATTFGGFGSLTYNLTTGSTTTPYVIGSLGYISRKAEVASVKFDAEGAFAYGAGVGVGFNKLYVEARYLSSSKDGFSAPFVLWTVGYTF
jgi:hypothetical protein